MIVSFVSGIVLRLLARLALVRCGLVVVFFTVPLLHVAGAANANSELPYVFEVVATDNGEPQTHVFLCVRQTRDGHLWVGAEGGLLRFDGVRFDTFRTSNTPAFQNNLVYCLHEDRAGALWIGTERGLVRYSAGRFERIAGLETFSVRALAEDASGRLWVGTHGGGLFSLHESELTSYANEPEMKTAFVIALYVDAEDRLWIGFDRYEGVVCRSEGKFRVFEGGGRVFEGDVISISEYPRGTLWFGTQRHRLFRLKDGVLTRFRSADGVPGTQISGIQPASDGGMWLAASTLNKVMPGESFSVRVVKRVPSDAVNAVCEDREGNLWLATRDVGLVRGRRVPFSMISKAEGLAEDMVKSVAEDADGNLWLTLQRAGAARVTTTGEITHFRAEEGLISSNTTTVLAARDGKVWLGLSDGLMCWENGRWEKFPEYRAIRGLFEDRAGRVWIGTAGLGVLRYEGGMFTQVLKPEALPGVPSGFCEAAEGVIYIGLWDAGLLRWSPDGQTRLHNRTNDLPANDVRALGMDSAGRLWVGFRSCGLAVHQDGRWYTSPAVSEAVGEHISAIIEDNVGHLWFGSSSGVVWAAQDELFAAMQGKQPVPRVQVADLGNILRSAATWSGPQPTCWKTRSGELLFATRRGLLSIDPASITRNEIVPPVLIERVVVDDRSFERPQRVDLWAGAQELAIEYKALSFVQPNRVFFRYQLEGYETSWINAGTRRTAYFTNLPPGSYRFRVQACNNDGVWNDVGATLLVVQAPHFYQTAWFYVVVALLLVVVAGLIYKWRTRALRRENEKLNRLVAERTRELALSNTAKTEFLEVISHEIRNPLHGLSGLLEQMQRLAPAGAARELLPSLQACVRSLGRVFEDVIHHTRLEHGQIEVQATPFLLRELLQEVVLAFSWHATQAGSRIELIWPEDAVDGFRGDEGKLRTIIENFVSNALKYAAPSPVTVRVEIHGEAADCQDVHIEVVDQGLGLPPEEQALLFRKFIRGTDARKKQVPGTGLGLATCRSLAALMGGHVGLESDVGKGSVFFLRVPLVRERISAQTDWENAPALIVEDEHYNQVVLAGVISELGLRPFTASQAEQADMLLAQRAYAVIFLDWELPGLKGGDLARRIRASAGGQQPIIIGMTAHDGLDIRRQCEAAGMDAYLRKPCSAAQIRRVLASARTDRTRFQTGVSTPADAEQDARLSRNEALAYYERGSADDRQMARTRFGDAIDEELEAIRQGMAKGDVKRLAKAAHRINALGGVMGDAALTAAARALEVESEAASLDRRSHLVTAVEIAALGLKKTVLEGDKSD
jgi:signal transduction histidine kinase/DNA-binding NarL/FixJ family response regulator